VGDGSRDSDRSRAGGNAHLGARRFYLVGTSRSKIRQYEKKWLDLPWQKVRDAVEVKLFAEAGELYVLAKSEGRRAKERAMRRKKLARLLRKLRAMQRSGPRRTSCCCVWARRGRSRQCLSFSPNPGPARRRSGNAAQLSLRVDQAKLKAAEVAGWSLFAALQSVGEDPAVLWERYVQLAQIEAAFKR